MGLKRKAPQAPAAQTVAYLKLTAAPLLWGGALVVGRVVTRDLPPFTIAWVRFTLAVLFMLPLIRWNEGRLPRPTGKQWGIIALLGVTGVVLFNFFLFSGLRYVEAGRSSIFLSFTPVVVALLSLIIRRQRYGVKMWLGLTIALLGALLVITGGNFGSLLQNSAAKGDLLMMGAVFSWALYSLLGRIRLAPLSSLAVLTYSCLAGALLLLPLSLWEGGWTALAAFPVSSWWSILYLSFGAAGLAYLWYYQGVQAAGSTEASVFMNLEPVAALLFGTLFLGEELTLLLLTSAVLVMGGVYLTTR